MGPFSSRRERRLWCWTLVVVAAIFASLGLSSSLVDVLADDNVAAVAFGIALLLVTAAVLSQGLQSSATSAEIAVAFGICAVILMALLRLTLAERTHLIEYGVLAVFIHAALTERVEQGRHVPLPALITVLVAVLIGLVDELIQLALPDRVFDPQDVLFNTLAAIAAVGASLLLAGLRRRVRQ